MLGEKKRELSKGTIFQKRDHTEIEEHLMHRNRGVLPSFIAGTAAQKSRSTAAINALYGLHLMHRNRGVRTAQFSRYGLHSF